MNKHVRKVGIIAHRFAIPGGIQTCFIELIAGLNQIGIIPDVLWDEPTNWEALHWPAVTANFQKSDLLISSRRLNSLPEPLEGRLRWTRLRFARFPFEKYDFVYSFEPGVKMSSLTPNLCYMIGPPFLKMPGRDFDVPKFLSFERVRLLLGNLTTPTIRPDKNTKYVTLSNWIAELCESRYGFRPPVIWPPVRSRNYKDLSNMKNRRGFLFLSRLTSSKRPELMLSIAERFKSFPITIAGAPHKPDDPFVKSIRFEISRRKLKNVEIVTSPTETDVERLLRNHEFFIFAAIDEHFGIVTVEAIQAGLIPIVHDSGGQKEIVPMKELRFNNSNDLIERASLLIDSPAKVKDKIRRTLMEHTKKGTAENFRLEMLKYLRDDVMSRL